ncbi:glutamine amidotransferase-related protein, partial [Staphylococcus aureus]
IDIDSLISTDLEVTHLALNDGTVEDLKHKTLPAYPVQYHPEANPGPSNSNYLFDDYVAMMTNLKQNERHINAYNVMISKQF